MSKIKLALSSLWYSLILFLPDEFSKYRVKHYNSKGCKIHKRASISPNVRIRGRFEMGEGSSIAQNCSVTGFDVGVFIGMKVMIAPNTVIVAFDHGYSDIDVAMADQENVQKEVIIEDDVWIGANCTIGKGVRIGTGSIVASNSFVNKDVLPFSIVGGVPAKFIKSRI